MKKTANLILTSIALASSAQAMLKRTNIILINIDDLGWADVSYNGSKYYETPNIDKLRNEGILFSTAYAAASNSAPSRACMLSGLYSTRHGVYTVGEPARGKNEDRALVPYKNKLALDSSFYTIPKALKAAGYKTCHIGKWHIGSDPLNQGMDVNIGGSDYGHPYSYFSPYHNAFLSDGVKDEYLTDRLASEAVQYMDSVKKDKPFFLYFATYAVHEPLQAKAELIEKYKNKKGTAAHNNPTYAAMIESMDASIGQILEAVKSNGLSENTFIIFTSDNGGVYNTSKQWPLRAGKGSFYEGGIREPFIVYMKGKYEGGRTIDIPVSQLDIYPTLTELAHAKPFIQPDGCSLLPLLDQGKKKDLEERCLYWHFPAYLEGGNSESHDPVFRSRPVSVIRQKNWKLIENYEDNTLELYNLEKDPSEKNNIATTYQKKTQDLYCLLNKWKKDTKAPIPARKKTTK